MTGIDPGAFRDFEFAGWQKVANRYHETFAGVTVQCIPLLLDAADVGVDTRVLDVACGPGYAATAAASRGARVVGIDFSSEMVNEARRRNPAVEFREGDAEALSFSDAMFDAVIMNFGLLHLGRPERAVNEARRVLRTEGRFAFTVWDTPDKALGFGIVLNAIRKHGDMNVAIPPGPPFFRFSDPAESGRVLKESGFSGVQMQTVPQTWRLDRPDALFDIMMNASVRNAALLRAQPQASLAAIESEIRLNVEAHRVGDGFELPMPAVLYSARASN